MPLTVRIPPINVVRRRPILSVRIPETGDRKNVVPIVNEPTRAVDEMDERKKALIEFLLIEVGW